MKGVQRTGKEDPKETNKGLVPDRPQKEKAILHQDEQKMNTMGQDGNCGPGGEEKVEEFLAKMQSAEGDGKVIFHQNRAHGQTENIGEEREGTEPKKDELSLSPTEGKIDTQSSLNVHGRLEGKNNSNNNIKNGVMCEPVEELTISKEGDGTLGFKQVNEAMEMNSKNYFSKPSELEMILQYGARHKSVHETIIIVAESVEKGSREMKEASNGTTRNQKRKKTKQKFVKNLEESAQQGNHREKKEEQKKETKGLCSNDKPNGAPRIAKNFAKSQTAESGTQALLPKNGRYGQTKINAEKRELTVHAGEDVHGKGDHDATDHARENVHSKRED
ncbi:Uncharacterized protein TCM_003641 [Theobroma cacao]|uniref:Uncharacterized protein n=1 Tax=Theobroma cacao TaxID=3641 RepID=A0A061DP75_THECC|nr:Uncharacterized protein TCM_003641 [Theobroma cacao]